MAKQVYIARQPERPACKNCWYFESDPIPRTGPQSTWTVHKNKWCSYGKFKVNLGGVCNCHKPNPED